MLKISPLKRALYLQASLIPKFFRDDTPGIPIKKEEGQKGKSERGEKERGLRHGCRRGMDAPWHRSLNHIRTGGGELWEQIIVWEWEKSQKKATVRFARPF